MGLSLPDTARVHHGLGPKTSPLEVRLCNDPNADATELKFVNPP